MRTEPRLVAGFDVTRYMSMTEYGERDIYDLKLYKKFVFMPRMTLGAPSVIQYHSAFGFALVWPFHFCFWIQLPWRDPKSEGRNRVIYFRIGARHDSQDGYYAFPSFYFGFVWN